jgi:shikimate dehydrogenase
VTKLAPVIGYPLAHSVSPQIYAAAFPAVGIDGRCDAWAEPPEALKAAAKRLRGPDFLGACITVPHKEAVIPFLDELDPMAERVGALNCIVNAGGRLIGYNSDLYGFMRSLREAGFDPTGRNVLLLGAGGSARAVAVGLLDAGVASLVLSGRSAERVASTAKALSTSRGAAIRTLAFTEPDFPSACLSADLIVNCTPIGMAHTAEVAQSPIAAALIPPAAFVYDLVYNPLTTVLLSEARALGAQAVPGLDMLVYQAAENVRLWTGMEPPIDIMRIAGQRALGGGA